VDESPRQAEGIHQLAALYDTATGQQRRPPWNWSALTAQERIILVEAVDEWVDTFNTVVAVREDDLIPPCWSEHADLADELAVLLWLRYGAYLHRDATPVRAADYRMRFLPSFRSRLDNMLGISPRECRLGRHPHSWRADADDLLTENRGPARLSEDVAVLCERLGHVRYGFPEGG